MFSPTFHQISRKATKIQIESNKRNNTSHANSVRKCVQNLIHFDWEMLSSNLRILLNSSQYTYVVQVGDR